MLKNLKLLTLFFSLALLNGCASSCGSSVETDADSNQANQADIIVPKQAENADIPKNTNTGMVNGAKSVNMNNPTLDKNVNVRKIDTTNAEKKLPTRKLADNSEVTVQSVGKDFVETRTYKSHPQLTKVEKIMNGKDIKYKVHLKDGKVTEVDESKIKDFRKAMANDFLKAVGVTPELTKPKVSKEEAELLKEKAKKQKGTN